MKRSYNSNPLIVKVKKKFTKREIIEMQKQEEFLRKNRNGVFGSTH